MLRGRVGVILAAVGGVLLAAGLYVLLSGGDGPTVHGSNGIRVSVPAGFVPIQGLEPEPELLAAEGWRGPTTGDGTRTAVFLDVFCAGGVETVVDTVIADSRAQLGSYELVRRRGVGIAGADAATRVEATYRQPAGEGGAAVDVTRFDQVAVSGRVGVRLAVIGPSATLDREQAGGVLDSLVVRPVDELSTSCATDRTSPEATPTG